MRLDEFYHDLLSQEHSCSNLWFCTKLLLSLPHGQAQVERGFSINRHIERENLSNKNVIAQRIIVDHVRECGGLASIEVSKDLIASVGCWSKKEISLFHG